MNRAIPSRPTRRLFACRHPLRPRNRQFLTAPCGFDRTEPRREVPSGNRLWPACLDRGAEPLGQSGGVSYMPACCSNEASTSRSRTSTQRPAISIPGMRWRAASMSRMVSVSSNSPRGIVPRTREVADRKIRSLNVIPSAWSNLEMPHGDRITGVRCRSCVWHSETCL